MTPRLMGMETEYAVAGRNVDGVHVEPERLASLLMEQVRRDTPHLQTPSAGALFLANGAKFYVDSGHHPEYCTPECLDPWTVARHVNAGDRLLHDAAAALRERLSWLGDIWLTRANVDYSGTGATWGCHESYLHRMEPRSVGPHLLSHLVTRIAYTGAGGFDSLWPGLVFMVSPRVRHLSRVFSNSSTAERPILHTKNERLGRGDYARLHLICGESVYSDLATVLKVGATSLVLAALESGAEPDPRLQLHAPLPAMKAIACAPELDAAVRLKSGGSATALEIQRGYLEYVTARLGRAAMPDWAPDLCDLWRSALDGLAADPAWGDTRLDWRVKHRIFRREAERRGYDDERLGCWNALLEDFETGALDLEESGDRLQRWAVLRGGRPGSEVAGVLDALLRDRGVDRDELRRFLDLREDLMALDTRCLELGGGGVFARLADAGALAEAAVPDASVEQARVTPPTGTRAALRGAAIKRLWDDGAPGDCTWSTVRDHGQRRYLDLKNPFADDDTWRETPSEPTEPEARRPRHLRERRVRPDIMSLLRGMDL